MFYFNICIIFLCKYSTFYIIMINIHDSYITFILWKQWLLFRIIVHHGNNDLFHLWNDIELTVQYCILFFKFWNYLQKWIFHVISLYVWQNCMHLTSTQHIGNKYCTVILHFYKNLSAWVYGNFHNSQVWWCDMYTFEYY